MVIGLLILTSIPTVTGVAQAIHGQKKHKEREKDAKRMQKFYIDVYCEAQSSRTREIHEKRLVLRDDRVWIGPHEALNPCKEGYVAEAFYIEYPDNERVPVPIGLVSQVRDDPPLLNWIYVDKDTMELKYGNKSASIEHHVGPWDWTEDEEGITFDDSEAFTAVEDPSTRQWQIYYDMDNDGLGRFVPKGRRKFQVSLERSLIPGAEGGK
ncbi:uncharacterized protein Z519_09476 [Cladophialophora bantiana CBS 173.52]|uniref:Uncharacterized protein n=1 Tax=Cladophialophora bantiana (strain ATCC 10958 / CBS 173.52 / CDC B-1940 / NIH 8579) TaxID=1442370 RepID=A0A0D2HH16_CLAB1|nr:uncharacterized protein Z519_09476 [Cladophialophora bantiana CBS 173.52]KIW90045.1 hypothetical protein Z519_09476 [Cladophialophora bantiana CBS 173.52]